MKGELIKEIVFIESSDEARELSPDYSYISPI